MKDFCYLERNRGENLKNDFDIHNEDANFERNTENVETRRLQIKPDIKPSEALEEAKDEMKGFIDTISGFFGEGKYIEVVREPELIYWPYWVIECDYECIYLNEENYQIPVNTEVQEVYIPEFDLKRRVMKEKTDRLDNILEEISISATGPSVSLKGIQDMMKGVETKARKIGFKAVERRRRNISRKISVCGHRKSEEDIENKIKEYKPMRKK